MARGKQREHRPHVLGPRIFFRGRWAGCDLRPWSGGRVTLRDPKAKGWPAAGPRTEDAELARRWSWAYVDLLRTGTKRGALGYAGAPTPLRTALRRFYEHRDATRSRSTADTSRTVGKHLLAALGERHVSDVTDADLQRTFDALAARGYAPATLATWAAHTSVFWQWCGLASPVLDLPPVPESDVCTWSEQELELLRAAADRLGYRLAVECAVATGAREAELFALRWSDFDAEARTVRIGRQWAGGRFRATKGRRARSAVVLPSWWAFHGQGDALILGDPPPGRSQRRRIFERTADTAGVNEPGAGWHRFRHTYARLFVEAGGEPWQLRDSLGHASIATTERRYGHFRGDLASRIAASRIYGEGLRAI